MPTSPDMAVWCAFCPSLATTKRGEHIFDDWLNRIDGKAIIDRYIVLHQDKRGAPTSGHARST